MTISTLGRVTIGAVSAVLSELRGQVAAAPRVADLHPGGVRVSTDGLRCVSYAKGGDQQDIFACAVDGSNARRLTRTPDVNEDGPTDRATPSLLPCCGGKDRTHEIFTMNSEAARFQQVAHLGHYGGNAEVEFRSDTVSAAGTDEQHVADNNPHDDYPDCPRR